VRRLRIVLCLIVLVGLLPVGVAGALALVEGDPGWDCTTMGNGDCGPDGPALVEGDPGWDCETMGNGDCGAESAALSGTLVAPPYTTDAVVKKCTLLGGVVVPVTACVTKIDPDPQTGAVELASSVTSANRAARSFVAVHWSAKHELPTSVPEMNYIIELDLESVLASVGPDSDATVSFVVNVNHDGCAPHCLSSTGETLAQVGNFEPCQEGPCGIDQCLDDESPCAAARGPERLTFPVRLQGLPGEHLPAGTVVIRLAYILSLSARPIGAIPTGGAALANASLDISRTSVTAIG